MDNSSSFPSFSNCSIDKKRSTSSVDGFFESNTPNETHLERTQLSVEQFLAMLRFENRSKVEELSITLE
jgi:hypothetical protein